MENFFLREITKGAPARAANELIRFFREELMTSGISFANYLEVLTCLIYARLSIHHDPEVASRFPLQGEITWQILREVAGTGPSGDAPDVIGWWLTTESSDSLLECYGQMLAQMTASAGALEILSRDLPIIFSNSLQLKKLFSILNDKMWDELNIAELSAVFNFLLKEAGRDVVNGGDHFYTPEPLNKMLANLFSPAGSSVICDPACGSGGSLIALFTALHEGASPISKSSIKIIAIDEARYCARLSMLGFFIHGIPAMPIIGEGILVPPAQLSDLIITHAPYGEAKEHLGSTRFTRPGSNLQLLLLHKLDQFLSPGGQAAIILNDDALPGGGRGEMHSWSIWAKVFKKFSVHTLLRLPTSLCNSAGKNMANVLFIKKPLTGSTPIEKLWAYDLRTNWKLEHAHEFPLDGDFDEFISWYKSPIRRKNKLVRSYDYSEITSHRPRRFSFQFIRERSIVEQAKSTLGKQRAEARKQKGGYKESPETTIKKKFACLMIEKYGKDGKLSQERLCQLIGNEKIRRTINSMCSLQRIGFKLISAQCELKLTKENPDKKTWQGVVKFIINGVADQLTFGSFYNILGKTRK